MFILTLKGIIWMSCGVLMNQITENDMNCGEIHHGICQWYWACSLCHIQSGIFLKYFNNHCSPITISYNMAPYDMILFPQVKLVIYVYRFTSIDAIIEKSLRTWMNFPQVTLNLLWRLGKSLKAMHSDWRRLHSKRCISYSQTNWELLFYDRISKYFLTTELFTNTELDTFDE